MYTSNSVKKKKENTIHYLRTHNNTIYGYPHKVKRVPFLHNSILKMYQSSLLVIDK